MAFHGDFGIGTGERKPMPSHHYAQQPILRFREVHFCVKSASCSHHGFIIRGCSTITAGGSEPGTGHSDVVVNVKRRIPP